MDATFLGVKCKTKDCDHIVELRPLMASDRGVEFPVIVEPMKIRCSQCGQTHEYQNSDLKPYEHQIP